MNIFVMFCSGINYTVTLMLIVSEIALGAISIFHRNRLLPKFLKSKNGRLKVLKTTQN